MQLLQISWKLNDLSSVIIVAQISTKIPNPFIAGMVYWLFLILVVGICVAGTGDTGDTDRNKGFRTFAGSISWN